MAREKARTNFSALVRELRESGPGRLYLLWGEEDYLRESFFGELKKVCLPQGLSEFNHHRLEGPVPDPQKLAVAADSVPFMGEHTLVEIRNFEINGCKDDRAQRIKDILSDIPDYCTMVFILPTGYEPDGRLGLTKSIKKLGKAIEFTAQPQALLIKWVMRRFAALGKEADRRACECLISLSGELMTRLIPEIEKISAFVAGDHVVESDVERLAQRIPEANVFEMTDKLAVGDYDKAGVLMAELLQSGEHPIMILAMIGVQMRKLYTAKAIIAEGGNRQKVMEVLGIGYPVFADKLIRCASRFSMDYLKKAVELCAESDYRMKSSGEEDKDILKELFLRMATGEGNA